MCEKAYLYLFDPEPIQGLSQINLSEIKDGNGKIIALVKSGFAQMNIKRRGKLYNAFAVESSDKKVVDIDEWQIALVNIPELVPSIEVTITKRLIEELGNKIEWLEEEVGEHYIIHS
ncbi:MAG: hypothetical protein HYW88_01135 [Candidatus Sungbacteria bacterium]|nr:hypothetical protein [Candidatus Sungbacteria bacterium]